MSNFTTPIDQHRQALLALAAGLQTVANTLHGERSPADTAAALIDLGPLFIAAGKTMRELPVSR